MTSYLELASLRLDSEWVLEAPLEKKAETQVDAKVVLGFFGPLAEFRDIEPKFDTQSLQRYITMRRMERDVERLENLEVVAPET